jgi:hypothetical protein
VEVLISKGYRYFAIPAPFLWWLDHYAELRHVLRDLGELMFNRKDTGLISRLPDSSELIGPFLGFIRPVKE